MTTLNGDACPRCGYAFEIFDHGACPRCYDQANRPIRSIRRSRFSIELSEDTLRYWRAFALWGLLALFVLALSCEVTLKMLGPLGSK